MYDNLEELYDNQNTHNITLCNEEEKRNADGVGGCDTVKEERSIVSYYLQVINPNISKSICDILISYQTDGMSYSCMKAILDDCRNDNHLNWSYISKVLSDKYNSGIRTIEDYRKAREDFQAKKQERKTKPGRKEYKPPESFQRVEM